MAKSNQPRCSDCGFVRVRETGQMCIMCTDLKALADQGRIKLKGNLPQRFQSTKKGRYIHLGNSDDV